MGKWFKAGTGPPWNTGSKLKQNISNCFLLIDIQCNISLPLAHSYRHRHTPLPPASPYICRSSWPLQKEGGGGEREREETKRGREGERGLVFTRLTHPHLPLYHSVLVLSIPYCTNITEALSENAQKKCQHWYHHLMMHFLLIIDQILNLIYIMLRINRWGHITVQRTSHRAQLPWAFLSFAFILYSVYTDNSVEYRNNSGHISAFSQTE